MISKKTLILSFCILLILAISLSMLISANSVSREETAPISGAKDYLSKFSASAESMNRASGNPASSLQLQTEIRDTGGQVYNVLAFGAKGDAVTDDTSAIQLAIDSAAKISSGRGGAAAGSVFFPSRRTYKITKTLTWRLGVRLIGSPAFGGVGTSPSQLRWEGPVGGTLLEILHSSQDTDYVQFTAAEYLGFSGGGKAANLIVFRTATKRDNRADFGTEFRYCTFDATIGDAISLLSGAANFHIRNSRFDNIQGFAVYIDVNETPSFLTIDTITWDTGRERSKPSKGFLYVAGEDASNNTYSRVRIANANMEVNVPLQEPKAIVYLGLNPHISNFRQHTLSIDNFTVNPVSDDLALVKLSSPADSKVAILLHNVGAGLPGTRIIEGTSTQLPISNGNLIGNLVFAPLSNGSGATLNGYYGSLGIGTLMPSASLHIIGSSPDVTGLLIQQAPNTIANLTEWQDADGEIVASISPDGHARLGHLISSGSTPSIHAIGGLGSNPLLTLDGTDLAGTILAQPNTGTIGGSTIATVVFSNPFSKAPIIILTPGNSGAAALSGSSSVYVSQAGVATTGFSLWVNSTPLVAGKQYRWNYMVIQ